MSFTSKPGSFERQTGEGGFGQSLPPPPVGGLKHQMRDRTFNVFMNISLRFWNPRIANAARPIFSVDLIACVQPRTWMKWQNKRQLWTLADQVSGDRATSMVWEHCSDLPAECTQLTACRGQKFQKPISASDL